MFFTISRLLQSLILPPSGLLILMAAGFLIVKKNRMLGRTFIASGFILLYLVSINPVAGVLMQSLEKRYPPLADAPIDAHAIVILSGGVRDLSWMGLRPEPSEISLERTVKGIALYRAVRIPLIVVGGSGDPAKPDVREADAMARTAKSLGVPDKDIIIENKARNTVESAKAVKRLLKGNRIILVTSAFHMKRAAGMFKKQGFDVLPAPTGYRSERQTFSFYSFIPHAGNLIYSSNALSEYLSLAWYTASGDI